LSTPSNLYAEKIYAENPTALWSLDDKCDFVSYFSETDKNILNWTATGLDSSTNPNKLSFDGKLFPFLPLPLESATKFFGSSSGSVGNEKTVVLRSPNGFSVNGDGKFSVGFYFYSNTASIESLKVFAHPTTTSTTTALKEISTYKYKEWNFFNFSELSSDHKDYDYLEIAVKYKIKTGEDYSFYINGFSIGSNIENFNTESTGLHPELIPNTISVVGGNYGIVANPYASKENQGYYVGNDSSSPETCVLSAKNSTLPMTFGALSSTVLYKNTDLPSLVVPGLGFLNNSGKFKTSTFEAWLRINTNTNTAKRIVGPIGSSDGLYVEGPFIKLKINDYLGSHFVGDWFRPMLIHIVFGDGFARVLLNGEIVISLKIDNSTLSLPDSKDSEGKDQDYIGFYAYDDIPSVEVDCVAIYPYSVPAVVALKRFGYGQAVVEPQNLSTAYGGSQIFFDNTLVKFSSSFLYPVKERWGNSINDNVLISKNTLGSPQNDLPQIILSDTLLSNKTDTSKWESDIVSLNKSSSDTNPYIKINAGSSWSTINGYVYFDRIHQKGMDQIQSIYCVVRKQSDSITNEQLILKLEDKNTKDHLSIVLNGRNLSYKYKIGRVHGKIKTTTLNANQLTFAVGWNISELKNLTSTSTEKAISNFVRKINSLALYVIGDYAGNDSEITTMFQGKLYEIGISTKDNLTKYFDSSNGTINLNVDGTIALESSNVSATNLMSEDNAYAFGLKLKTFDSSGKSTVNYFAIDASTKSYWKDYVPLSTLATQTPAGIDTIQFNIDYPAQHHMIVNDVIDSSSELVKSYIIFHNKNETIYNYGLSYEPVKLNSSMILDSTELNQKYEVFDGTIIHVPVVSDLSQIIMTTIIEIKSNSTKYDVVNIRHLNFLSQTYKTEVSNNFDEKLAKPITTRLNTPVYSYKKNNANKFTYKGNPHRISKNSSPYLNLSKHSGIKNLKPIGTNIEDRGIYIPINQSIISNFYVSSINTSLLLDSPESGNVLFEIINGDQTIYFYIFEVSNGFYKIVPKIIPFGETVSQDFTNIKFYINGIYTNLPILKLNEWVMLGAVFTKTLQFPEPGSIKLLQQATFNNFSYYQINKTSIEAQLVISSWSKVFETNNQTWGDVKNTLDSNGEKITWRILEFSSVDPSPEISPKTIFQVYTGTNKIFGTDTTDISGIRINKYQNVVYSNIASTPTIRLFA
jgi:hypothetical protein